MSPVLQLLLVLVIILFAARVGARAATRLGQPAVLGELIAGVILGPTAIDLFDLRFLTDAHLEDTITVFAQLGVIFLMFLAGLETDLDEVKKVRRVATYAGVLGVVFPIVLGTVGTLPFGFSAKESIFIGIILSATSVSISARTLMQLGVLQGRQGVSILAAAVIDDVLVITLLSFFTAFAVDSSGAAGDLAEVVGRIALFFAVAFVVGGLLLPLVARWARDAVTSEGLVVAAIILVLLSAWFAEYVGEMATITGAFLAGVFVRRTDLHRTIEERVHVLAYVFFVPIFFVSVGLSANARGLGGQDAALFAVIVLIAVVSKVAGCGIGALLAGEPAASALRIGTGMVPRGEVELIIATIGLSTGLIEADLFAVVVLIVVATALLTPVLLRLSFGRTKEARYA